MEFLPFMQIVSNIKMHAWVKNAAWQLWLVPQCHTPIFPSVTPTFCILVIAYHTNSTSDNQFRFLLPHQPLRCHSTHGCVRRCAKPYVPLWRSLGIALGETELSEHPTPSPDVFRVWMAKFVCKLYLPWLKLMIYHFTSICHWFFQLEGIKLFPIILAHACLQADVLCSMLIHHCL